MEISVRRDTQPPGEGLRVEVVERKGIGHPDTISDGIAESFSVALSRFYIETFGHIQHHNVDKSVLVGGRAEARFGGGRVLEPALFYTVGRVTLEYRGVRVPVEDIFQQAAKDWVRRNLRFLDPDEHVKFHILVRPGSQDLVSIFQRNLSDPLANDTSFGVGYWPLSPLESAVLGLERYLNSPEFKREAPWVGEDIKVMGVRVGDRVRMTLAAAMVSRFIQNKDDYFAKKEDLKNRALAWVAERLPYRVELAVNVGDTEDEPYITVTGTSAESGDDGQVGRGNRVNGLICPYRPMSLEAAAGKNPLSHVGKTYNILANTIARRVVEAFPEELAEARVFIVSQIGRPVSDPWVLDLSYVPKREGELPKEIKAKVEEIAREEISKAPTLWREIIEGKHTVY